MSVSASRPYAALKLHQTQEQQTQIGNQESPLIKEAKRNLSPESVNESGRASIQDPSSIAEHDLGPTNIDPWDDFRDIRLRELAIALATAIRSKTVGITRDTHLAAYVLLTRFGQSCEDIHRILRIPGPASAILQLIETTGLPLNETVLAFLKAERESWEGSNPDIRVTKWIKQMIAGAPVLLRMHRRSDQVRMEFKAYTMWHRLEMEVDEIAEYFRKSRREIFELIRKTLKYGNPPFFPFQRARYLSLLDVYAPNEYKKELERTSDEVSSPSATSGATMDVLSMSGLDSFDEGDFVRYTTGWKDAVSPSTFGRTKHLDLAYNAKASKKVKVSKTLSVAKTANASQAVNIRKNLGVAKTSKTIKGPSVVKVAKLMKKATPTVRSKALSPGEVPRYGENKKRPPSSENDPAADNVLAKAPEALTPGLKGRSPRSAAPQKRLRLKNRIASEKSATMNKKKTKKSDPGDSDWLKGMAVWRPIENPAVNADATEKEDPGEEPQIPESRRARKRRRRAGKPVSVTPSGTKAKAKMVFDKAKESRSSKGEVQPTIMGMAEALPTPAKEANTAAPA